MNNTTILNQLPKADETKLHKVAYAEKDGKFFLYTLKDCPRQWVLLATYDKEQEAKAAVWHSCH